MGYDNNSSVRVYNVKSYNAAENDPLPSSYHRLSGDPSQLRALTLTEDDIHSTHSTPHTKTKVLSINFLFCIFLSIHPHPLHSPQQRQQRQRPDGIFAPLSSYHARGL